MARSGKSYKKIRGIARKEFSELMHEKTFILSVLIQLFIASFSTFLVIGLTSFYDPTAMGDMELQGTKIAVVGTDDNELYNLLQESKLNTKLYSDLTPAYTDFYERRMDAIIIIPSGPPQGEDILNVEIYLPKSEIKSTLISMQLKEPLEQFEQQVRDIRTQRLSGYSPIDVNIIKRGINTSSTYFEFVYVALLPLLVFTPAFISGGLIIDFITEEYERKTMELLLASPASLLDIVSGKVLLATAIVPLQSFAWMLLLRLNWIRISNFFEILLVVTIIGLILVLLSSSIALTFKDRGVSQLLYSMILIFLFMVSYLFTNSPLNLVTRLSIESIGSMESGIWILIYSLVAAGLYVLMRATVSKNTITFKR
ncbi:ABC transporter permease [Methanolobus zinderi]|uniref:ABC transporter permease n=1 Tax=Methanolobus zinderi TaxID=536044 RepID=A0A7D5EG19_9EURY|nr:ABC transporter permease [Methanolobus zinderi]QLC51036.1 ABC transporter permease [Methanolobus zinderi]